MLQIKGLTIRFGGLVAIDSLDLVIKKGEITALIGPNGAGKSTTLRTISGLIQPAAGTITFEGRRVDGLSAGQIVRLGISQVPEGRQIFPELTVMENLRLGAYIRKDKKGIKDDLERVIGHFPVLGQRSSQIGGTLSGGEQQMLAIGRALMARPKLLLLDEPSLGLAPLYIQEIFKIIEEINREGSTILLVEQNANMALRIAHFGYVMGAGRIVLHGKAEVLRNHEEMKQPYLGTTKWQVKERRCET